MIRWAIGPRRYYYSKVRSSRRESSRFGAQEENPQGSELKKRILKVRIEEANLSLARWVLNKITYEAPD